jgi:hypothetical protein
MSDDEEVRHVQFRPEHPERSQGRTPMSDEVKRIQFGPKRSDETEWEFTDQHGRVLDRFHSQDQVVAAMSDERYKSDASFRRAVILLVHASNMDEINLGTKREDSGRGVEQLEIQQDYTRQLFSDPRYKTSAVYRREVEDFVRSNTPSEILSSNPTDPVSVSLSTDPSGPRVADLRTLQIAVAPKITGPNKPGSDGNGEGNGQK